MADGRQPAQAPRRGEKHGWIAIDRYVAAHEGALERHGFVVENLTGFERAIERFGPVLALRGEVRCLGEIVIGVVKSLAIRRNRRNQTVVRGLTYRYHVRVRGRGDLLRYDNSHELNEFHRHEFDFPTQRQKPLQYLTREEFPTLIEVIDEVQALAGRLGLVP